MAQKLEGKLIKRKQWSRNRRIKEEPMRRVKTMWFKHKNERRVRLKRSETLLEMKVLVRNEWTKVHKVHIKNLNNLNYKHCSGGF